MTEKQLLILGLLDKHKDGLFGSEIVEKSEGRISKMTVYTLIEQLVDAGCVREFDMPAEPGSVPRTKHVLSERGRRALNAGDAPLAGFAASPA